MSAELKIVLCDDDAYFRARLLHCLEQALDARGLAAEVKTCVDAESLIPLLEAGETFDVYLLDVIMPGQTGIDLARHVRRRQPEAPILFFTTSEDYALEAFSVGATHYVVKPFEPAQFEAALDRALAHLPSKPPLPVVLKTARGLESFEVMDVVSAETSGHLQNIALRDGRRLVVRMSGHELWRKLEPSGCFVRAGVALIVNLAAICAMGSDRMELTNGQTFRVPRRVLPDVRTAFLRYNC